MVTVTRVQEYGNMLAVIYSDGSRDLAYPTGNNLWYVKGATGIGEGDFYWPFSLDDVTSEFGWRDDPLNPGTPQYHSGMDFAYGGIEGDPIYCAGNGQVTTVGNSGSPGGTSWGNRVIVDHVVDGIPLRTAYAHMQDGGFPAVTYGQYVDAGSVLGYVGHTGAVTGNHLHFVTYVNGVLTNPRDFMEIYNPANNVWTP